LIGSDCPGLTKQDIEQAWACLGDFDVVLGPARDGGYWLIGLRALQPALFQQVAWSTPTVLAQSLERAQQAGLRVALLRELSDVDTHRDWVEHFGSMGSVRGHIDTGSPESSR
jgi:glycosyltransferase A (GT-A) superfamily protein (DUF2064 family)